MSNKPMFTQRHYNAIYAFNQKLINELSNIPNHSPHDAEREKRQQSALDGVIYAHKMLAKLFIEDNDNFKPKLWELEGN